VRFRLPRKSSTFFLFVAQTLACAVLRCWRLAPF